MQAMSAARANLRFNRALYELMREREIQRKLIQTGKVPYDLADSEVPRLAKLATLAEELGEVARDILDANDTAKLRHELVQLATLTAAWIESEL